MVLLPREAFTPTGDWCCLFQKWRTKEIKHAKLKMNFLEFLSPIHNLPKTRTNLIMDSLQKKCKWID